MRVTIIIPKQVSLTYVLNDQDCREKLNKTPQTVVFFS